MTESLTIIITPEELGDRYKVDSSVVIARMLEAVKRRPRNKPVIDIDATSKRLASAQEISL